MNSNNPPVVVGVDHTGRPLSLAALRCAVDEAQVRGTGISVVHGCAADLDLTSPDGILSPGDRVCRGENAVAAAAETLRRMTAGQVPITVGTPMLTGEQALVNASAAACLVVVQRQSGTTLGRLVAGSTASTVAAHAACPVLVVHSADEIKALSAVIVGVDDHGHGQQAMAAAADEAASRRLPLTAVQAWMAAADRPPYVGYVPPADDPAVRTVRDNAERSLAEAVAGLQESHPDIKIHQLLMHGDPVDCLLTAAGDAALLVVARHSSPHLATFGLGHVARTLINRAPGPVMVTPPSRPSDRRALAFGEAAARTRG